MRITVCGAAGRMGQAILRIAKSDENIKIAGAVEYDESPALGTGVPVITKASEIEKILQKTDVIIDFTNPESTLKNLEFAKKHNVAVVIGTTGFSQEQKDKIAEVSKFIPVVFSPNMSIGVNVLFKLVEEAAKKMKGYDIEIVELHHNKKKDAPSGTAVKLADVAAEAVGKNMKDVGIYGREGIIGERTKEEIGVMSVRGGDIVGEHTVYYIGMGERLELTHRAQSRDTFAAGSVRAAKWLAGKKPGLYDMQDVLELK
ncbi:MAG: 4-hydroxy-tetrahydrodipicolinate reductase [Endomicrobia bacterium]|nr:4-hydroxy-tetrahydrodipicolinate reductase [Endomicrobiia bacterium]MCL2506715.1 4-hydroxy-tetrahydrodipicolinate reductase [Endomicrobiia bacterium]